MIIVGIFAALLVVVAAFIRFIPPRLFAEAMSFTEQLPSSLHTVNAWIDAKLGDNELIAPMIEQARRVLTPELAAMISALQEAQAAHKEAEEAKNKAAEAARNAQASQAKEACFVHGD